MWSEISNSVFRDNIEGNRLVEVPRSVRKVIDTPEFQRLRHIHQTGLTFLVFPTAEHSRFAHSIGVYGTAMQAFRHLERRSRSLDLPTHGLRFDEHASIEFGIAALCHDIGHSAFSHVLETILLPNGLRSHESCTLALLEEGATDIAKQIKDIADLAAVRRLLGRSHANLALAHLISSAFDVDRCDYILRDSRMTGVEYGKFDLKWLLHSMTLHLNERGQPVLLLDGPRGLDALRQFLSARRYMHRHIYYHPAVRAAQILLKSIFTRMQDLEKPEDSLHLAPPCLHAFIRHEKLSLEDFIWTTDVEIQYMIRRFSVEHPDPVLRYLSNLFIRRQLPKCVLDSARTCTSLAKEYLVQIDDAPHIQGSLLESSMPVGIGKMIEGLKVFIAEQMKAVSLPGDAAQYLVASDPAPFLSTPPADLLFSFQGRVVSLEDIDSDAVGFDIDGLLESFTINRVFVPKGFSDSAREYIKNNHKVSR